MSAGKGMTPRKGYNQAKYAANYDSIFRAAKQPTQPAKEPMNTQDNPSPLPTILPWHREAAAACFEKTSSPFVQDIITSIARHDPHAAQHATTLRLLEEALDCISISDGTCHVIQEHVDIREQIRAHLAAMKGTQ